MYKYLLIITLMFQISCDKNENMDVVDTGISLSIVDNLGKDLLNPDSLNSFNNNNVKLYYLKNGIEEFYHCGNCDLPNGFTYDTKDHFNTFVFRPNFEQQQNNSNPITYIQWNESDRDTVQCQITRNGNNSSITCTKVWYNGELVWNSEGERFFTITK